MAKTSSAVFAFFSGTPRCSPEAAWPVRSPSAQPSRSAATCCPRRSAGSGNSFRRSSCRCTWTRAPSSCSAISSPTRSTSRASSGWVAGEGPHQDAVKKLVQRNAGYSLLIESVIARELASRRLVALKLDGAPFPTDVEVAYRSPPSVSPAVRHFIEFMRKALASDRGATESREIGRLRRPRASHGRRR
jgi:DNA-binding transcriptional LysR family regulator